MGKIFVVRPPTTKTTNILPHETYTLYTDYTLYTVFFASEGACILLPCDQDLMKGGTMRVLAILALFFEPVTL